MISNETKRFGFYKKYSIAAGLNLTALPPQYNNCTVNPLSAKLFNLNFYPLEVVSR